MTRTVVLWAMLLGVLCAPAWAQQAPPPAADLSTPERALRSYWAVKDWYEDAWRRERMASELGPLFEKRMAELTLGKTQEFFRSLAVDRTPGSETRLERRITATREEGAERVAIEANVRNVTPISRSAAATAMLMKMREDGENFRYVLRREGGGWRILEVWRVRVPGDHRPVMQLYDEPVPMFPAFVPPQ